MIEKDKSNTFLIEKIAQHCFENKLSKEKFVKKLSDKYNKKNIYVPTRQGLSYILLQGRELSDALARILAHELDLDLEIVKMSSGHLPENMKKLARHHPEQVVAALEIVDASLKDEKE